jgi:HlyD family secretion protein
VAASFQAPVLFVIAQDLTKMRVNAAIDEADVGRVQPGQEVTFRVDAFPDRTFAGRLEQVRLQPTTVQNVVTYNTIISVDNDRLQLRPGMTATVSVIVRRADQALRIPAAALRYRPEGFQPAGPGGGGRPPSPGGVQAAGGPGASMGPGGPGGGRPEGGRPGQGRRGAQGGGPSGEGSGRGRRTTIFVMDDSGTPKPTQVALGISDGQFVEVKEGLTEGQRIVVGAAQAGDRGPRTAASPSSNPFSPQFQRRQR